eukprot:gene18469-18745_t
MASADRTPMYSTWNCLPDELQLTVTRQAMLIATQATAHQADLLAHEFEAGFLPDRGGSEALRLLATLLRTQAQAVTEPIEPTPLVGCH